MIFGGGNIQSGFSFFFFLSVFVCVIFFLCLMAVGISTARMILLP